MTLKNSYTFLLFCLTLSCSRNLTDTQTDHGIIMINYTFSGIKKGFDHLTKTEVYLDHKKVAESEEHKQSQKAKIEFIAPEGEHFLEIINLAYYKGKWEPHLKENKYNQDCNFSGNILLENKLIINVIFDLDKGTKVSFIQK